MIYFFCRGFGVKEKAFWELNRTQWPHIPKDISCLIYTRCDARQLKVPYRGVDCLGAETKSRAPYNGDKLQRFALEAGWGNAYEECRDGSVSFLVPPWPTNQTPRHGSTSAKKK